MPLNKKGRKIMGSMKEQYGKKRGEQVFYARQDNFSESPHIASANPNKREDPRSHSLPRQSKPSERAYSLCIPGKNSAFSICSR